jgi:hypothetical protein
MQTVCVDNAFEKKFGALSVRVTQNHTYTYVYAYCGTLYIHVHDIILVIDYY